MGKLEIEIEAARGAELVVLSLATPSIVAITDSNKKALTGFVVTLLSCFGAIIAFDVWVTRRAPAG
jgi:hypothetical protein